MSASHPSKIRKVFAAAAASTAVAVPLVLTTGVPAEATTSVSGCSVSPLKPTATRVLVLRNGVFSYDTRITYNTRVTCAKDRIIRVYDQRWEQDAPAGISGDDFYGSADNTRTFAAAGTVTLSASRWLSTMNSEAGAEELFHRVTFKVATINGVSAWTSYENSPVLVP